MSKRWSKKRQNSGGDWGGPPSSKKNRRNRGQRFNTEWDDHQRSVLNVEDRQEGAQLRNQVHELLSWVRSDQPRSQPPRPYQQPVQYPIPNQQGYQQYNTPNRNRGFNQGYNLDYNKSSTSDFRQGYNTDFRQGYNKDFSQDYSRRGKSAGQGGSWSRDTVSNYAGPSGSASQLKSPLLRNPPNRTNRNFHNDFDQGPTKKMKRGVRGGKKAKAKRDFREQQKHQLPPSLPQDPEERRKEVLKRIETFSDYIREGDNDNAIMTIEKGLRLSKVGLLVYYDHEVVHKVGKSYILTGRISLSEVYLARAIGGDKQKVRLACYRKALQVLKEKTVPEILALKDVGVQALQADAMSFFNPEETYDDPITTAEMRLELMEKGELTVSEEALNKVKSSDLVDMKVEENLVSLLTFFKENKYTGQVSLVHFLDYSAPRQKLEPKCEIKILKAGSVTDGKSFICEFFLQNVLISSGSGNSRVSAQAEAYENAYSVLTTSTIEELLERGKAERPEDPNVDCIEVWPKAKFRRADTNIWRLKLHKLDPIEICKEWYDAVVIETHNWCGNRKRNAFSILLMTANWNGMLLEWNTQPLEEDPNVFKCVVHLQKYKLGEAISPDKQVVRNLAAADGLFKLYETQAVIKVKSSFKSHEIEITAEQVKERASQLKAESGDTSDDDIIITMPEHDAPPLDEDVGDAEEHEEKEEEEIRDEVKDEVNAPRDRLVYQMRTEEDKSVQGSNTSLEDIQGNSPEDSKSENGKTTHIPGRFRVNKWHKMAIEEIMKDYSQKDTLQEMRFLSGFTMGEIQQVKEQGKLYGLKVLKDKGKGEVFFKVLRRRMPWEVLEALIRIGDSSGRFTLVPRNELPQHKDVEKMLLEASNTLHSNYS